MQGSSQREQFSSRALQFCDAFLVFVAFWLADELRPFIFSLVKDGNGVQIGLQEILWILLVVVPFTPIVLELFGFYKNLMRKTRVKSLRQITQSICVMGGIVAIIYTFGKLPPSSRFVLAAGFGLSAVFLYMRDHLASRALRKSALEEGRRERVALAGSKQDIQELLESMPDYVTDYWNVIQHFELGVDTEEEMESVLTEESIQRVIIASRTTVFREISRLVELCEKQGIEAWVSANFIRTQVSRPTFDNLGGKPMLVLRATPELSWTLLAKNIIDRTGAFLFIFFTSPLWVMAIIGIRISSPGASVFFKQDRAGKYGKPFKMWKFRTMVPDAETKLAEVKEAEGNEMSGPVFKLENDPRIFPFARFLRKWSIDELPQMINVLTGDMSLVGPRPLPVYEVREFEKSEHRRRLSVKPGITCTWQVGGRNTITNWEEWVKMDLAYIDNWSLWLDIKLLILTVPAVLFGKGAK